MTVFQTIMMMISFSSLVVSILALT
ncbi:putative holin-like toxin [Neobacillus terrae]